MNKNILAVVIPIITGCCFFANTIKLPEGGFRPRCPNFKLGRKPYQLKPGDCIDTNAIYLYKKNNIAECFSKDFLDEIKNSNDPKIRQQAEADSVYSFWHFFSNGRAVGNGTFHYPTNLDLNNIWSGTIGYYKLDGNEITLETYEPVGSGGYDMVVGKITNDTILFYKRLSFLYGFRPMVGDSDFIVKTKEPWMKFWEPPDW